VAKKISVTTLFANWKKNISFATPLATEIKTHLQPCLQKEKKNSVATTLATAEKISIAVTLATGKVSIATTLATEKSLG
jgi:hypothetical protein